MKDPIVEQTRQIRREIEQEFGNDPQKYLNHIYEAQKQHGSRLVRRESKPSRKREAVQSAQQWRCTSAEACELQRRTDFTE